jgi:hypothetical protein
MHADTSWVACASAPRLRACIRGRSADRQRWQQDDDETKHIMIGHNTDGKDRSGPIPTPPHPAHTHRLKMTYGHFEVK